MRTVELASGAGLELDNLELAQLVSSYCSAGESASVLSGVGTIGQCDGYSSQDLNALWAANPAKNSGAGAVVQAQLWYRDPLSTSNQTSSLSDAIEFTVAP